MAMGKLSKKIKSEKINMLRKQYDSYLEEEKIRKERNKFILEKLNKISSCNSLMPFRNTSNISTEVIRSDYPTKLNSIPINKQQLSTKFQPNNYNEVLISEISKNYILIPKIRNNVANEYIRIPEINDEQSDWKSKYDILNQLKQNEKHASDIDNKILYDENSFSDLKITKVPLLKQNVDELPDRPNNEEFSKYNKDTSEISVSNNNQNYESYPQNISQYYSSNSINEENVGIDVEKQDFEYKDKRKLVFETQPLPATTEDIQITEENKETVHNYNHSENLQEDPEQYNVLQSQLSVNSKHAANIDLSQPINPITEMNKLKTESHIYDTKYDDSNEKPANVHRKPNDNLSQNINDSDTQGLNEDVAMNEQYKPPLSDQDINEKVVNLNENNISPNEVIKDCDTKINTPAGLTTQNESFENGIQDATEYPIETINVQEFTPNDGVELIEGVNINPEGDVMGSKDLNSTLQYDPENTTITDSENVINTSETEAINGEQNQTFYSEEQNQNYEAYNVDSSEPNYSGQNENYDNYQYYEGEQTDNNYVQDVNQYEESTQRYDLNYEQQYEDQYEQKQHQEYVDPTQYEYETNEQPQYPEQDQQQFVEPNQYEYDANEEAQYSEQKQQEFVEPPQYEYETNEQSSVQQYNDFSTENQNNDGQQSIDNQLDNEQGFPQVDNTALGQNQDTIPVQ